MFLQNLIARAPSANLPAMLVAQLLPFIKNLAAGKWSDEDILEDIQFVRDELETNFASLTWVVRGNYSDLYVTLYTGRMMSTLRNSPLVTCHGPQSMNQRSSGAKTRPDSTRGIMHN